MKIKTLIKKLQKHDPEADVLVQDYNWNDYELDLSTGFSGQAVLIVSPVNEEEAE